MKVYKSSITSFFFNQILINTVCYPKYSPLLGQQYFSLGTMHFICEDIENALIYFRKAFKVFKICYNENHSIRLEVEEKITIIESN